MLPPDYRSRVYAGWLGKCIGVRLGVPVENWTADEIARNLGEIGGFLPLPPGTLFPPDDDTAVPLILVRALERYGTDVSAAQLGEELLNGLADGRGTIWWGGYGRSSEHTAYLNLAGGIDAPQSGSAALNGRWLAEQIGGQIFSDVWGLVAPGNPALAASLAARASSVTHDGAGIEGGRFVAALVSQAFTQADPAALVEAGLAQLAPDGPYAQVVRAVRDHAHRSPNNWRGCYRMLAAEFGPEQWGGPVHIIPNAGVVALALLYSGGDFSRAIQIATMAGWDTDCNAGNVGAIMGVAVGLEGIGEQWRAPVNDLLLASGVLGSHNLADIPGCADRFGRLAAQLAGEPLPEVLPRFHFGYPGTTHGMMAETENGAPPILRQVAGEQFSGGGALQITLRNLEHRSACRVWVPTYLRPSALSSNSYGPSFSPTVAPGQTMRARVVLPPDAPPGLRAALFAWDDHSDTQHQAPAVELAPGEPAELVFRIPQLHNALLSRAGLALRSVGNPWSGRVLVDWLDWGGPPEWSSDFGCERREYDAASGWTLLRGFWRLEDGAYHGSGVGSSESYTGDPAWGDGTLDVELVPLLGERHYALVRVDGARRSYAVGLDGAGRLAIHKNAGGYREVASAPLEWAHGQRLHLTISVAGPELAVSVNGHPSLRWRDEDGPYLRGAIGLGCGPGCHTRFERVAVRGADW